MRPVWYTDYLSDINFRINFVLDQFSRFWTVVYGITVA